MGQVWAVANRSRIVATACIYALDDFGPMAGAGLTEQVRGRIPRAVVAAAASSAESHTFGSISRNGRASAPARCAIDVSDGDHHVHQREQRGGVAKVGDFVAQKSKVAKGRRHHAIHASDILLQAEQRDAEPIKRGELREQHRAIAVVDVTLLA